MCAEFRGSGWAEERKVSLLPKSCPIPQSWRDEGPLSGTRGGRQEAMRLEAPGETRQEQRNTRGGSRGRQSSFPKARRRGCAWRETGALPKTVA